MQDAHLGRSRLPASRDISTSLYVIRVQWDSHHHFDIESPNPPDQIMKKGPNWAPFS
jgi:hypothetical protein